MTGRTPAERKFHRACCSIQLTNKQIENLTDAVHSALSEPLHGVGDSTTIIKLQALLELAKSSSVGKYPSLDYEVRALHRHASVMLRKSTALNPNP